MRAWIFARLTLREASRSRLLPLAAGLTLLFVALLGWGSRTIQGVTAKNGSAEGYVAAAGIEILAFFVAGFMIALLAVFVPGPSLQSDAESGLLQAMLARPVHRLDVLAGKWLGSAVLLAIYIVLLSAGIVGAVGVTSGFVPERLPEAIGLLLLEALVVISLRLLFGTFLSNMPSGIVPLMLYGLARMGGLVETVGNISHISGLVNAGIVSSLIVPTDVLERGASYFLQPADLTLAARAVRGDPFASTTPLAMPMLLWSLGYVAIVFLISARILSRRDI